MNQRQPSGGGAGGSIAAGADVIAAVRRGHLIAESRRRWACPDVRDRWSLRTGAVAFLIGAAALAAGVDWGTVRWGVLLLAVPALAVASLVELELGSASAVPTEPIVVAMLLLLPAGVVPLAVLAALVASSVYLGLRRVRRESVAVSACSSFFALGPALVVKTMGLGPPGPRWWAVIGLAFLAQVASDLAISWWRNCVGLGLGFGEVVGMLRYSYSVDLLLAPTAVAAVIALDGSPQAILLALCPAGLIALLARDRAQDIDTIITLGSAYSDASGQARQDALTGLANRLAWDEALATEAVQAQEPAGVLMLDVDHLKWINDQHGHDMGDRLLMVVANVLRHHTTTRGLACRLGGDEFGILVMGATPSDLAVLEARVRQDLSRQPLIGGLPVSASIGCATAWPGAARQATEHADQAMYRDKEWRRATRTHPDPRPAEPDKPLEPITPLESIESIESFESAV